MWWIFFVLFLFRNKVFLSPVLRVVAKDCECCYLDYVWSQVRVRVSQIHGIDSMEGWPCTADRLLSFRACNVACLSLGKRPKRTNNWKCVWSFVAATTVFPSVETVAESLLTSFTAKTQGKYFLVKGPFIVSLCINAFFFLHFIFTSVELSATHFNAD